MTKPRLRQVAPDETPPQKPRTVAEAARAGTHRDLLVAMRDRIAVTVTNPDCPPRDLASLTRRLQDIAKELEALDAQERDEKADTYDGEDAYDASAI